MPWSDGDDSGVQEIVLSATICSSSIVRRRGGKGGGDFRPAALRMNVMLNPWIVFIGSLDMCGSTESFREVATLLL